MPSFKLIELVDNVDLLKLKKNKNLILPTEGTLECGEKGWDKTAECVEKQSNQCASIAMVCRNAKGEVVTSYTAGVTCQISCEAGYRTVGNTNVSLIN